MHNILAHVQDDVRVPLNNEFRKIVSISNVETVKKGPKICSIVGIYLQIACKNM